MDAGVRVKHELSHSKVSSIAALLAAYSESGYVLRNGVDGGAGAGIVAEQMLPYLEGEIFAFEPFSGNHKFFHRIDPRVRLIPHALANAPGYASFRVPSVVGRNSPWGRRGMRGYSSLGQLVSQHKRSDREVGCVRGDDFVPKHCIVDVIKLDLQGGELEALNGMERLLSQTLFLWVEYIGSEDLLLWLHDRGFQLFDTQYVFLGKPTEEALNFFEVDDPQFSLSTGKKAWTGFRRSDWYAYQEQFSRLQNEIGLMQTDLVCIHNSRMHDFECALEYI